MDGFSKTMTCSISVNYEKNTDITFKFNNNAVTQDENNIITRFQQGRTIGKNLTIIHIKKHRDEGNYSCTVKKFNKTETSSRYLKILYPRNVVFECVNRSIKINAGDPLVRFVVTYKSNEKPHFEITNPKSQTISFDEKIVDKSKYDVKINETTIELFIMQVDIDDFGNYKILGIYEGYFPYNVTLIVYKKPSSNLTDVYVRDGDHHVAMHYHVEGFPRAKISWSE